MSRLYFADPADPTHATIGLDLDGLAAGDPTGFEVRTLNFGDIAKDFSWHTGGDVPGGEQIRAHPGPVLGEMELFADYDDLETLLDMYQLFGQFLEAESVLVFQPEGISVPRYFDTYPSDVPALWRGARRQGVFLEGGGIDQDYVVRFWHHPYPRRDPVTLLDQVPLTNTLADNVATFDNPGTALSEAKLIIENPGTEWVTQVRVGIRHGDSDEFQASLSGFPITAIAVTDYWKTIDRIIISPSEPANFAGVYRAIVTLTLADDIFHLELQHGATQDASQPLANTNEEVILDATDLANFDPLVEVDLGLVSYDAESESLVVEIHAWSESGTNMGAWGNLYLIPADDGAFLYSSPGWRTGEFGKEIYRGELFELTGDASMDEDDTITLHSDGDIAEVKPTAGQVLAEGPHILTFRGGAHNRSRTRVKLSELQVLKNGAADHAIGIFSKKGRSATYYGEELTRRIDFRVTNPADLWRFRVEEVEATSALRFTKVAALVHRYVPIVTDHRRFVIDAGTRRARIEADDGARVASLRATGLPFLEPGPGALAILSGEPATSGYSHVDERGVLPKIDEATSMLVTLIVTPRDLQA